jgi:DNA polymerase iota
VTCNYEARRRGLKKLQLVTEAKKTCPDVVIVLGEELGRFRDASKALYKFLEAFTWSGKVERLGFDEVFMDVTDIVDFNQTLLNPNSPASSFFQLKKNDPTVGFLFDATKIAGHRYPSDASPPNTRIQVADGDITLRLILGSHMAQHLRWSLEELKGYTSTVGISTNKLCAKLVGNLNKPKGQTTLLPPYTIGQEGVESNVTKFIDSHDIGKIPGIGFRMSQKIRNHILLRPADFEMGLIYGRTKESVTVRDVRLFAGMGPELLENILGGPGAERGLGGKVWGLINGVDDTEVQQAKKVPTQISIEDSYIRLDTIPQVLKELRILATSLLKRMHVDLLEDDGNPDAETTTKRWVALPKTVRISTRPRPAVNVDGTRQRSFNRISRSGPLPNFVFSLKEGFDAIVERLVQETLVPMFRKLHPYPSGWNLSLVNIGVTNMIETANEDGTGGGRDIGIMFKRQEEVLKEWRVEDRDVPPNTIQMATKSDKSDQVQTDPSAGDEVEDNIMNGSEDAILATQNSIDESDIWEEDEEEEDDREKCQECGAVMPAFAMAAHERFHGLGE